MSRPFTDLGQYGTVMVIVDQPRTIGALPVAVTLNMGLMVAYLPGLTMSRRLENASWRGSSSG